MSSVPWSFPFGANSAVRPAPAPACGGGSPDLIGGDCAQEHPGRGCPACGRCGRDDDTGARLTLNETGEFGEVMSLDLRYIGIDHAGPGPAEEPHAVAHGELPCGRGVIVGQVA